jgi:hypothetical protein
MRFRTQALGGLATVATIAGLITKDDKSTDVELLVFFGVLLLFWIAAWAAGSALLLKAARRCRR